MQRKKYEERFIRQELFSSLLSCSSVLRRPRGIPMSVVRHYFVPAVGEFEVIFSHRQVPPLRRSSFFYAYPELTRWAQYYASARLTTEIVSAIGSGSI